MVEDAAGGRPGILLEYVRQRPSALTDPAPQLPVSAVRLAHALHREGHTWVVLPRCARCGRAPAQLRTPRPEGRICYQCAQRGRLQTCVRCGQERPPHVRSAAGPVCSTCHTRPAGLCGQSRPLARRAGPAGPAICGRCDQGSRIRTCSACGRMRPAHLRRADGKAYCRACYPRPQRKCARCGRLRVVNAVWPVGLVCGTCYAYVRRHPATCARCGQAAALVGAVGPEPVCGPCAGWDGPAFTCRSCGAPDMLEHGRCFRCVLGSTLDDLVAGAGPGNEDQLQQLAATLKSAPGPRGTLRWLRSSGGGRILAGLAAGAPALRTACSTRCRPQRRFTSSGTGWW